MCVLTSLVIAERTGAVIHHRMSHARRTMQGVVAAAAAASTHILTRILDTDDDMHNIGFAGTDFRIVDVTYEELDAARRCWQCDHYSSALEGLRVCNRTVLCSPQKYSSWEFDTPLTLRHATARLRAALEQTSVSWRLSADGSEVVVYTHDRDGRYAVCAVRFFAQAKDARRVSWAVPLTITNAHSSGATSTGEIAHAIGTVECTGPKVHCMSVSRKCGERAVALRVLIRLADALTGGGCRDDRGVIKMPPLIAEFEEHRANDVARRAAASASCSEGTFCELVHKVIMIGQEFDHERCDRVTHRALATALLDALSVATHGTTVRDSRRCGLFATALVPMALSYIEWAAEAYPEFARLVIDDLIAVLGTTAASCGWLKDHVNESAAQLALVLARYEYFSCEQAATAALANTE